MLPAGRVFALAVLLHAGIACTAGPTAAQLETDNPIRPNADPPFGMDDFFKEAPQQPHPARVRLGRWLFYDVRLSANRTVSCATCHRPSHAFSEPSAVSTGINASRGTRKTPSIINLAARTVLPDVPDDRAQLFFWDGRATSLESQVLAPIANTKEMGLGHEAMVERFSAIAGYRPYFREAFGSDDITPRAGGGGARGLRSNADERERAVRSVGVRTRWPRPLRAGPARQRIVFLHRDAAPRVTPDSISPMAAFTTLASGGMPRRRRSPTKGVRWSPATTAIAARSRRLDSARFPNARHTCTTVRSPRCATWSSSTIVAVWPTRGGRAALRPVRLTPSQVDDLVAFLQSLDGEGYHDQPPRYFPR